jgi:hypothetical protein
LKSGPRKSRQPTKVWPLLQRPAGTREDAASKGGERADHGKHLQQNKRDRLRFFAGIDSQPK